MKYTYIKFTNASNRDFVCSFDREYYEIKAGVEEYYPPFLAKHFAKRLADREMMLVHKKPMHDTPERNSFMLKCLNLADEKTLETVEKNSLKSDIEKQRDELIKAGKIDDKEYMEREIMGDEAYEEMKTGKPKKKPGRPKKIEDDGEFEGSVDKASAKLQAQIPKI